jgi:hypothetical protein
MKKFLGIDCQEVGFGDLELLIAEPIGPRILSLSYQNSGNIFAELPDTALAHPTMGEYKFYGGHRLWVAPEEPAITYEPDNRAVEFEWAGNGVNVIGEIEPGSGLRKSIRIQTTNYLNVIQVDHLVRNEGSSSRKIAPWAITQLKLGGTAVLPLQAADMQNPLLPNRSLVLWPYTDLSESRLKVGKELAFIRTLPKNDAALKVGASNLQQWIAYFIGQYLFVKYSKKDAADCALDLGAEAQSYCNGQFLELETLGSYRELRPGETIEHREIWRMEKGSFASMDEEALGDFLKNDEMAAICREML